MKRIIATMLAICFLIAPAAKVHADLVIEPGNSFYEENREKCVLVERNFIANGPDGKIEVKEAPNSKANETLIENGAAVYVEFSCRYNGEYWGVITYGDDQKSGWLKMDQVLVVYDHVSFAEEHASELYQYTGDFAAVKEAREMVIWPWPGSGNSQGKISDIDAENFSVLQAYKDKDGREWGFVPYFYGRINFWICISDPTNDTVPAFNPAPEPTKWVPDTEHTEIGKVDSKTIGMITILIGALTIVTATLICVFWKPWKKQQ